MNFEIEDGMLENEDEIDQSFETTEEINHTTLNSRRRIERFIELKQLRDHLGEPYLNDIF